MKERPILFSGEMVRAILDGRKTMTRRVVKGDVSDYRKIGVPEIGVKSPCPYGQPGDRLIVRETWATEKRYDKTSPAHLPKVKRPRIHFIADGPKPTWAGRMRPSIFMPRWASRITLEITAVRVERVQDISEEDAKAEGCPDTHRLTPERDDYFGLYPTDEFAKLWGSLNARRGYGWDANPWVWVISFRRLP